MPFFFAVSRTPDYPPLTSTYVLRRPWDVRKDNAVGEEYRPTQEPECARFRSQAEEQEEDQQTGNEVEGHAEGG